MSPSAERADMPSQPAAALLSRPAANGCCRRKVFVLGMLKCGMSSLHNAFISCGLRSVHWALGAGTDMRADKRLRQYGDGAQRRLVALLMQRAVAEGLPPLAHLDDVDAIAQMDGLVWDKGGDDVHGGLGAVLGTFPQITMLKELCDAYPDAVFILNIRNLDSWAASVSAWTDGDLSARLLAADLPGLPPGKGSTTEELVEWSRWHTARVQDFFAERGAADRLLTFDIERDDAACLRNFLGHPHLQWGHCNQNHSRRGWSSSNAWSWKPNCGGDHGSQTGLPYPAQHQAPKHLQRWPPSLEAPLPLVDGCGKRKVLALGLLGCGAGSLHETFLSCGLRSVNWALGAGIDLKADKRLRMHGDSAQQRLVALLMQCAAVEGRPPLAYLNGADAVAQMDGLVWDKSSDDAHGGDGTVLGMFPQITMLEELYDAYPNAAFILNVRNLQAWAASIAAWTDGDLIARLVVADLPGLPSGKGGTTEELVDWLQSHTARVRAFFTERGADERLLTFDVERDEVARLHDFLGYPQLRWDQRNPHNRKKRGWPSGNTSPWLLNGAGGRWHSTSNWSS
eukprot:NODE_4017_length_1947_cov_6.550549.p1 GENE.NODE_4017_length_1947_cov_6.550549~~NODE_4017_length_1947_cov_6.550549.p1  ORF type:complete len:630 (-),score=157.17 NODE_4017_length_1947_cov_6.550549:56-1756(-)